MARLRLFSAIILPSLALAAGCGTDLIVDNGDALPSVDSGTPAADGGVIPDAAQDSGVPDAGEADGGEDGGAEDGGWCAESNDPCATKDECCKGLICPFGACQPSVCGDGYTNPDKNEECDDQNADPGDGCELDCTFTCLSTDPNRNCKSTNPCHEDGVCDDAVKHTCAPGNKKADGFACDAGKVCDDGTCKTSTCGDGIVDPASGEDCDFGPGANLAGSGCEPGCKFSCTITPTDSCPDGNICNGLEQCGFVTVNGRQGQKCQAGTVLGNGTPCGAVKICMAGECKDSVCGDGYTDSNRGEECEDGNLNPADGCEPVTCKFTCLSIDAARDCSSANPCVEDGVCDDLVTHVCTPGVNKQNGTACGAGDFCTDGRCNASVCGDTYTDVSKGEDCDDGNLVPGDGCEPVTCKFSCSDPSKDCASAPACKKNQCTNGHVCEVVADSSQDGNICGNGLVCKSGNCETPPQVCGNGKVELPEECDDGNETTGDGCEPVTCNYSCHTAASDCPQAPVCNAAVCADVLGDGGKIGQKCGTTPADEGQSPAGCDAPNTCKSGVCTPPTSVCGNAVLETGEDCDFGAAKNLPGSGCEPNCKFSCAKTPADSCPDNNPCNGLEVCTTVTVDGRTGQKCFPGSQQQDGTSCGSGNICLGGQCKTSICGDGYTDAAKNEQCDFGPGANTSGSGCEPTCLFSCQIAPSDTCPDGNQCNGVEACNTVTVNGHPGQKCSPGTPLTNGTACGAGGFCTNGQCNPSTCGDGYIDASKNEECDDKNSTPGDGCEPVTCKYTCLSSDPARNCASTNPCVTDGTCGGNHICIAGANKANGTACGAGGFCTNGQCNPSTCGDGYIDASKNEECDDKNATPGDGCEPVTCKYTCLASDPTRNCASTNPCFNDGTCGTSHICVAGSQKPDGTSCGAGNICLSGQCKASTCGDGYIDAGTGEQCEPPNTASCDSKCKTIKCGDNQLAGPEQCDDNDGTPNNLDGCDSACKYEMVVRMTSVVISGSASPSGCSPTTNRFGAQVLTGTARDQLNPMLQDEVNAGNTNVLIQMLGLDDLTGTNDSSLQLGIMTASLDPAKGTWPGNNPIDWWYLVAAVNLDSNDLPLSKFTTASISGRQVSAGPNDVTMSLLLGGSIANLQMRGARLFATVDNPPAPNTPAPPPSLLAAGTSVLQSVSANASGKGLCGNITVESLSKIPIPEALTTGTAACSSGCSGSRAYTYCGSGMPVGPGCNSLLDAIVGGCKAIPILGSCIVGIINAYQPDAAGSGYQGTLTLGAGNKVPDSQVTGNTRGYSSFFTFTANRGHATGKK